MSNLLKKYQQVEQAHKDASAAMEILSAAIDDLKIQIVIIDKSNSENPDRKILTPEVIKNIICEYRGVEYKKVFSKTRVTRYVRARQLAQYFLKKELRITFAEVGRLTGGYNPCTVSHSFNETRELKKIDKITFKLLAAIQERLNEYENYG